MKLWNKALQYVTGYTVAFVLFFFLTWRYQAQRDLGYQEGYQAANAYKTNDWRGEIKLGDLTLLPTGPQQTDEQNAQSRRYNDALMVLKQAS